MDTNFSMELKTLLDLSHREAVRHNDRVVRVEHILLAIMSSPDNTAYATLQRLVDADTMYQIRDNLDKRLHVLPDNGSQMQVTIVSDLANRIIKLSVLEARMLKSNVVDSKHLLLALFHNNEVQGLELMEEFKEAGVTYESLYRLLANVADSPKMGASFGEDEEDEEDDIPRDRTETPRAGASKRGNDTPALDKYGNDMTLAAEEGRLDPVVGREVEIERLAQILSRRKKNNPVLIGEPGVGKSAIVEGLALRIVQRKVSRILFDKRGYFA